MLEEAVSSENAVNTSDGIVPSTFVEHSFRGRGP